MRKLLSALIAVTALLFTMSAMAQNKVVVIPLNSKASTTCTAPDEVLSQGQCWKDRNLGATRVAINTTDVQAYGDLYQWGRLGDAHQNRINPVTPVIGNSNNDVPTLNAFLRTSWAPFDWRDLQNDNLWQGLGGINNPCPQDFRLPTEAEFNIETASWANKNAAGAYASPLKLVLGGYRSGLTAVLQSVDITGNYWTSTVSGTTARYMSIESGAVNIWSGSRNTGYSVRCIKN